MAAWGKLESTFARDPKWKHLGRILGVRRAEAAGLVACLYSWASGAAPDGYVGDLASDDIEEECLWEGEPGALFTALKDPRIGVLERSDDGGLMIHRFMERAESHKAAQRKRREREKKMSQDTSRDSRVTVTTGVTGEREERERGPRGESEGDRVREEGPPPVSDSLFEIAASQIPMQDAIALVEHYDYEAKTKRGQVRAGVVPPMAYHHARIIIAHAGRDLGSAKRVVTAFVHSDHEWWKKKRWPLSQLTDPKDFEHAERMAAKGAASRVAEAERKAQPDLDAQREEQRLARMSPRERAAELRASAANMRRLNPGSTMADELEAKAEALDGISSA